jgi:hypothetical protein
MTATRKNLLAAPISGRKSNPGIKISLNIETANSLSFPSAQKRTQHPADDPPTKLRAYGTRSTFSDSFQDAIRLAPA